MTEYEAPETYPLQFRDKIDEYLWKEHRILGGCCSSIEEMKYSVAREVVEKLTNAFIEQACSWLKENKDKYLYNTGEKGEYIPTCSGKIIDEFRTYMEGETL